MWRPLLAPFSERAETDADQVLEVLPVAPDQLQPAITVVAPPDTDFLHAVTAFLGQEQQINIEHITVDAHPPKQIPCHCLAIELEAALRVADVPQADDQAHGNLESPRTNAAIPLLWILDHRLSDGARAEDEVVALVEK